MKRNFPKKKSGKNEWKKGNESGGKEMDPKVEIYSYWGKKNPIPYMSMFFSICNAFAGAGLIKLAEHVSLRVKIKTRDLKRKRYIFGALLSCGIIRRR